MGRRKVPGLGRQCIAGILDRLDIVEQQPHRPGIRPQGPHQHGCRIADQRRKLLQREAHIDEAKPTGADQVEADFFTAHHQRLAIADWLLATAMLHQAHSVERRQKNEIIAVDQRCRVMHPEFRGAAGGDTEAGQRAHPHVDLRGCERIKVDLQDRAAIDLTHDLDTIPLRNHVRGQSERSGRPHRRSHRHPHAQEGADMRRGP
ncbi:hypothetical protein [Mesorhizobium shangrilense]|uniref:hypothetical protein n=1 Tax=Mesorhizobium shangrilense TaxID=460060 RepID=UPI003F498207